MSVNDMKKNIYQQIFSDLHSECMKSDWHIPGELASAYMNLHYEQLDTQHKETRAEKNNNTINYLVKINYTLILLLWLDSKIKHKLNNKIQTSELLCFEMILTAWSVNISVEYFPNWSTTDSMLWWKSNPHISPYQRE